MPTFILRRLLASVLILLGASFIVYMLVTLAGDPLRELRESNARNKDELIAARTALLHLDVPVVPRYFGWLKGAAGCITPYLGTCDLGSNLKGQAVTAQLSSAIPSTLQLVTTALLLAIVVGVAIGIITALRQYSGFDYLVTFVTFLFFSLPVFWVAVLLKEFGAIRFNDFLAAPHLAPSVIAAVGVVVAVLAVLIVTGSRARRALLALGSGAVAAGIALYLSASQWFAYPGLGAPLIAVLGAGIAVTVTAVLAGLQNRQALWSALIVVGMAVVAMFALRPALDRATIWLIFGLGVLAVAVGAGVGYLMGGYDRRQSMKVAGLTSFLVAGLVLLDRFFVAWPTYMDNARVRDRPIATIGSQTANLGGDFWLSGIDKYTHLILPTAALILISLASYTRYSRASMLEVMGQDYVRTARAKGMPERVVIMRHAFRNALIPIATIVAFDIGFLLGGAVITEYVFSFSGMGAMFAQGLRQIDPNPVMGFFLVTGITAVVFNLLADLAYSVLDPRVRVKV